MFCSNKNSYLQSIYSNINPRTINRCVTNARKEQDDFFDSFPGRHRIASYQPTTPLEYEYDQTKIRLSYGAQGLPILKKNLQNSDPDIVLRSLSTLNDQLNNPEKVCESIRLKILDRLVTVIPREEPIIRERCFRTCYLLSKFPDGRSSITQNPKILELLLKMMSDEKEEVRINVAKCLANLSESWMTADSLVEEGFINAIVNRLGVDSTETTKILMDAFVRLLYGSGKYVAMEAGAFDILISLLDIPSIEVRSLVLDALLILTSTELGKHMALKCGLLKTLAKLLYEDEKLYMHTSSILIYCTILPKAKIQVSLMKGISSRIVALCCNPLNPTLQLMCLKVLTNIAEHPDIRSLLKEKYLKRLMKLQASTNLLQTHKKELISVIMWDPSDLYCSIDDQEL